MSHSIKPAIQVKYTCHGCTLVKAVVTMRAREDDDKIRDWMDYVRQEVSDDHARRSPHCTRRECDLMIPVADDKRIGGV